MSSLAGIMKYRIGNHRTLESGGLGLSTVSEMNTALSTDILIVEGIHGNFVKYLKKWLQLNLEILARIAVVASRYRQNTST